MLRRRSFVLLLLLALVAAHVAPSGATHDRKYLRYFIDPTVEIKRQNNIEIEQLVYVAPFARLKAGAGGGPYAILLLRGSDVQDNVLIDSRSGQVAIGKHSIIAHGATVKDSSVGVHGTCPPPPTFCASFVGFNAEVDGAVIELDAMVSALSRVGPGVRIPSGYKTIPGRNIETQEEVASDTEPITDADREFIKDVTEVNESFALGYKQLSKIRATFVRGINVDPGRTEFNPERNLPTLNGIETRDPDFRNRIIGDVRLSDGKGPFSKTIGNMISLRADEGEPFAIGTIACMGNRTTFHALAGTSIQLGDDGCYGTHSLIHGGPNAFDDVTITGDRFTLGDHSIFYKSRAGNDVTIGDRSLVQGSDLPDGTVIPPGTVMINDVIVGTVEW